MYKCSDCGKEFIEKPQFCDCGNINFIETQNKTKNTKNSYNTINISSVIIFVLCIILSILSLIFIGRDNNSDNRQNTEKEKETVVNITMPDIDEIWKEQKNITQKTELKENLRPKIVQKQPVKTPQIKKTKPVQQKKENKKQKANTTAVTTQKPQTITKPPVSTVVIPKKLEHTIIEDIKPVTPIIDEKALQQELKQYKKDLRNRIAADINFLQVYGDGNCLITFKIDSTGKLIDRKFAKLSDNESLNDAVFSAVKKNPQYKNPPKAYKNELLKLSVKIYGGKFEVNLI